MTFSEMLQYGKMVLVIGMGCAAIGVLIIMLKTRWSNRSRTLGESVNKYFTDDE
jgi:hypothetical protein